MVISSLKHSHKTASSRWMIIMREHFGGSDHNLAMFSNVKKNGSREGLNWRRINFEHVECDHD